MKKRRENKQRRCEKICKIIKRRTSFEQRTAIMLQIITELVETNYQWQMDLADLKKLRGYNHMYRFLQ